MKNELITYNEFLRLYWLKTDRARMRVFYLPSNYELFKVVYEFNDRAPKLSRTELIEEIKNNRVSPQEFFMYDGMDVLDYTFKRVDFDAYVLEFDAVNNVVIIVTD